MRTNFWNTLLLFPSLHRAFEPLFQFSGEHQAQHPEIADERPERMSEGGRLVALDQEMPGPGKPISQYRPQQGIPGMAQRERNNQCTQPQQRARSMHHAVAGMAVLAQIEAKKLIVAVKTPPGHDYFSSFDGRDGWSRSTRFGLSSTSSVSLLYVHSPSDFFATT